MKQKVLKQAGLPDALTAELQARYDLYDLAEMDADKLAAIADEVTVVITNGEAVVTRDFIASLPALKLIAVFGVGYDGVDVAAARDHGVAVTHTPGVLTDDVADLAIGLMLATSRRIVAAQKFIEQGDWSAGGFQWTRKVSGARLAFSAWAVLARPSRGVLAGLICILPTLTARLTAHWRGITLPICASWQSRAIF